MDEEKRKELIERRGRLNRRRALDDVIAQRHDLFELFDKNEIAYEIVHPTEPSPDLLEPSRLEKWLTDNFPFRSHGVIDWEKTSDMERFFSEDIRDYKGVSEILSGFIMNHELDNPQVIVISARALTPIIRMTLSDVARFAEVIFSQDGWDTWVFDPESDWCIEYFHEGGLSFGRYGSQQQSAEPQ